MRYLIFVCFFFSKLQAHLYFTKDMISQHLQGYSDEEIRLINKDLVVVRSVCLDDTENAASRFYLATAGAPGARKTTILEKFVSTHPQYQKGIYLDPDSRTLRFMVHTYYANALSSLAIAEENNFDLVIKKAYDKWRSGSHYIVLSLLEEAFAMGRSITYGTTSTGGHLPDFFTKLKENGYEIILLLCSSSDELRYQAVDHRNREIRFYQSSPEDALSKGLLFAQRMSTYFTYADCLYFYWSDNLFTNKTMAGIWRQGKLEVLDSDAMNHFIDKYETDRMTLEKQGKSIPYFSSFLTSY